MCCVHPDFHIIDLAPNIWWPLLYLYNKKCGYEEIIIVGVGIRQQSMCLRSTRTNSLSMRAGHFAFDKIFALVRRGRCALEKDTLYESVINNPLAGGDCRASRCDGCSRSFDYRPDAL